MNCKGLGAALLKMCWTRAIRNGKKREMEPTIVRWRNKRSLCACKIRIGNVATHRRESDVLIDIWKSLGIWMTWTAARTRERTSRAQINKRLWNMRTGLPRKRLMLPERLWRFNVNMYKTSYNLWEMPVAVDLSRCPTDVLLSGWRWRLLQTKTDYRKSYLRTFVRYLRIMKVPI